LENWLALCCETYNAALDERKSAYRMAGVSLSYEVKHFLKETLTLTLAEVLADFRAPYQRVLAATRALSWETLNEPFPWYDNNVPVGAYPLGNTVGHYETHGELIQRWLESQA
jgi:hypothetical protein